MAQLITLGFHLHSYNNIDYGEQETYSIKALYRTLKVTDLVIAIRNPDKEWRPSGAINYASGRIDATENPAPVSDGTNKESELGPCHRTRYIKVQGENCRSNYHRFASNA